MKIKKYLINIFISFFLFSFSTKAQLGMDCDSFCVESIIVDTNVSQGFIVIIKNYNAEHVNYPTIDVIDKATNNLVATDSGMFTYFAHITGQSLAYHVYANTSTIPDSAIVTITDNIWNLTCSLSFPCNITNTIAEINESTLQYYWNGNQIILTDLKENKIEEINLFEISGRNISTKTIHYQNKTCIVVNENIKSGIYFLNGLMNRKLFNLKIIKM